MTRLIALEARIDDEWVRVAEKTISSPQQGNPYKTVMEDAVTHVRVVQEVDE